MIMIILNINIFLFLFLFLVIVIVIVIGLRTTISAPHIDLPYYSGLHAAVLADAALSTRALEVTTPTVLRMHAWSAK